jgi:hypothetical protein
VLLHVVNGRQCGPWLIESECRCATGARPAPSLTLPPPHAGRVGEWALRLAKSSHRQYPKACAAREKVLGHRQSEHANLPNVEWIKSVAHVAPCCFCNWVVVCLRWGRKEEEANICVCTYLMKKVCLVSFSINLLPLDLIACWTFSLNESSCEQIFCTVRLLIIRGSPYLGDSHPICLSSKSKCD